MTEGILIEPDSSRELGMTAQLIYTLVGDNFSAAPIDVQLGMRPLNHAPAPLGSSLSDRQTVDDQLRFYSAERCLRQFRAVCRFIRDYHGNEEGTVVEATAQPTEGDWQFLGLLAEFIDLTVTVTDPRVRAGWQRTATREELDIALNPDRS